MITAAQRETIKSALGRHTLQVSEQIDNVMESGLAVPEYLWRELLAALNTHHREVMETVPGKVFAYLVEEKIRHGKDRDDAGERHRRPGGGFPIRKQF
ncbi:MAG: hypothetical protein WBE37_15400 [Bryobacteraceae bacterium]